MLINGCRHNDIDQPFFKLFDCFFQRTESSLTGFRIGFRKFYFHLVVRTIHYTQTIVSSFRGRINNTEVSRQIQRLTMISSHFRRTVNNRSTQLQHNRICKSLQYHFIADAVNISLGNTNPYFRIFHVSLFISLFLSGDVAHRNFSLYFLCRKFQRIE